jgi:hypothetical protein
MTLSSRRPIAYVEEKTEVIYGVENIIKDAVACVSSAKECIKGREI